MRIPWMIQLLDDLRKHKWFPGEPHPHQGMDEYPSDVMPPGLP